MKKNNIYFSLILTAVFLSSAISTAFGSSIKSDLAESSLSLDDKVATQSSTITVCEKTKIGRLCNFNNLQSAVDYAYDNHLVDKISIASSLSASASSAIIPKNYPYPYTSRNIKFVCVSKNNVLDGGGQDKLISGGGYNSAYSFENCTFQNAEKLLSIQDAILTVSNNNFVNGTVSSGGSMSNTHRISENEFYNSTLDLYIGNFKVFNNVFRNSKTGIRLLSGGNIKIYNNTFSNLENGLVQMHDNTTTVVNNIASQLENFMVQNNGTIQSTNTLLNRVRNMRIGKISGKDENVMHGDPRFIDSELRISSSSPAVDTGIIYEGLAYDKEGKERIGKLDLGAFEASVSSAEGK